MQTENIEQTRNSAGTYGDVLHEVIDSTKDVIRSEMNLFSTELSAFLPKFEVHAKQAAIFGGLLAVGILPFLAFLVIGLGLILDGRYWLSSLIVSAVCFVVGGTFYQSAIHKIKTEDFKFTQTKLSLQKAFRTTKDKVDVVKAAAKGDRHGQNAIN